MGSVPHHHNTVSLPTASSNLFAGGECRKKNGTAVTCGKADFSETSYACTGLKAII